MIQRQMCFSGRWQGWKSLSGRGQRCFIAMAMEHVTTWLFVFFFITVDFPELHGREGYEDEIDGENCYDLADNLEIQLWL